MRITFLFLGLTVLALHTISPLEAQTKKTLEERIADYIEDESLLAVDKVRCKELLMQMVKDAYAGVRNEEARTRAGVLGCLDRFSNISATPKEIARDGAVAVVPVIPDVENSVEVWSTFGVRFVKIRSFTTNVAENLWEALKETHTERLIIDLRDNPGGWVDSLYRSVALFAPRAGVPVTVTTTRSNVETKVAEARGPLAGRSIALLVNRNTASSAELFAGVLKYWGGKNVVIIGERTYGKTLAQSCILCDQSIRIMLTIKLIEVGSLDKRLQIQGQGIEPDIKHVSRYGPVYSDSQLCLALQYYGVLKK